MGTRAAAVVVILLMGLLGGCAEEATTRRDDSGWWIYRNTKYAYEIAYPDSFELWETGTEGRRDGATIRVARKEYTAPAPVLDVWVVERESLLEKLAGDEPVDMTVTVIDVEVSGRPAKQAEFRWKANGELAFVELEFEDALFRFHAAPGLREFEGTVWWDVVSSYRSLGE